MNMPKASLVEKATELGEILELGIQADMAADGQVCLLDRGPERVVALVPVVGQSELRREEGELQGFASLGGSPLDLGDGDLDVVDRDLVGDDESLRVDRGELGERGIEGG